MSRRLLLIGALALQLSVLVGMVLSSVWPLWVGAHVRLAIVPIDPRSLFRGNYARLDYEIATLPRALLSEDLGRLRVNEIVYVSLREEGDIWRASAVSVTPPERGVYLRGRLQMPFDPDHEHLQVRYGIEAWFASRENALEIERSLRATRREASRASAEVAIAPSGRAALVRLHAPAR